MTADSHDAALARRALITGAAVLGAAAVASVANAPEATAANGDSLRLGRDSNSATAGTVLTVDLGRGVQNFDPGFKVVDNREGSKAVSGQASYEGTGVFGVGQTGVSGVGLRWGGRFNGEIGVDAFSVDAAGIGVRGRGNAGDGVWGTSGTGHGVKGTTAGTAKHGVHGSNTAVTGTGSGVVGQAASITGVGVQGIASHAAGITQGVRGDATSSPLGTGVAGLGQANGVYGESRLAGGRGVHGSATQEQGSGYGVYGVTASPTGAGVFGAAPPVDMDLQFMASSFGVFASGAVGSSGPAFLGVPEYGIAAKDDPRLTDSTMTFSADFSTASPKLIVYVKNSDGGLYKAELPLSRV